MVFQMYVYFGDGGGENEAGGEGLASVDLVEGAEAVVAEGGLALGQWAVGAGRTLTGHVGSTPLALVFIIARGGAGFEGVETLSG